MAIHIPIDRLKPALGWSQYRDANPVPTNPLAHDIWAGSVHQSAASVEEHKHTWIHFVSNRSIEINVKL